MRKGLTYGGKRALGITVCILLLIFLFCMFAFSNKLVGKQEILMLLLSLVIILFVYWVLLYVPTIPDLIAKPVGVLLPLLYTLKRTGEDLWSTVLFLLTCLAFAVLLYCINGFIKDSKTHLKRIENKLYALSETTDWIKQGKNDYKINSVKINTIPNEVDNVSGIDYIRLNKALKKFGRGALLEQKTKRAMLVFGNFGSGKSSAILKYAYNQVKSKFINPNAIPLYVRLTDLFDTKLIEQLMELGPSEYEKWESYLYEIRNKAFKLYYSENSAKDNSSLLEKLNEENRIIYLFDGFNEILQSQGACEKRNANLPTILFDALWKTVQGNRFILTTSTYPGVITNRIIETHENETDIYVIKGIELTKEETEKQCKTEYRYESLYNASAALYSLKQKYTNEKLTPYVLLNRYVEKMNPNLNADNLKILLYLVAERIIKDKNIDNPYLPFAIGEDKKTDWCKKYLKSRLFRIHQTKKYTICHALIFEFLLVHYAKQFLQPKKEQEKSIIDQKQEAIYKKFDNLFIVDKKKPYILNYSHVQEALKMLIVDTFINEKNQIDSCKKIIKYLFDNIEEKKQFLLMLSKVQDEILLFDMGINDTGDLGLFGLEDILLTPYISDTKEDISRNFQIYKLMSINEQRKRFSEKMIIDSMEKNWTHIGIKRKILQYCIDEFEEWREYLHFSENDKIKLELDSYLLDEYSAELLKLNTIVHEKEESKEKKHSFYEKRVKGIKKTTCIYWVMTFLLFLQILLQIWLAAIPPHGMHISVLAIKLAGLLFCFWSKKGWTNQLWKNEEYYGVVLGKITRDEPIHELLNAVLGRDRRKYAKSLIGDWMRNRPSIAFLLISAMTFVYIHEYLCDLPFCNISFSSALIIEILLACIWIFVCCFPHTTLKYIIILCRQKETKQAGIIAVVFCALIGVFFMATIAATSLGVEKWGPIVCLCFVVFGFTLALIIWFKFIRKAHGMPPIAMKKNERELQKKEEKERAEAGIMHAALWERCIAFIVLLIMFCGPGIVFFFFGMRLQGYLWPATALISFHAFFVALSLQYASLAKLRQNKKNDRKLLEAIELKNWDLITQKYPWLSCRGQIDLLNRLVIDKSKLKDMSFLKENAKTVQALDILLDAEL